jgi:hypothetical protein
LFLGDERIHIALKTKTQGFKPGNGQKGIAESGVSKNRRKGGVPRIFVEPSPRGAFAEGSPNVGGEHLYLAYLVGNLKRFKKRTVKTPTEDFHLFSVVHFHKKEEKLGMVFLDPTIHRPGVKKYGIDVVEFVEARKEGSPGSLIGGLESGVRASFGHRVVCA